MRQKTKLSDNSNKKKRRRKAIIKSTFLVLFLLGINTFAWFTYISRADVSLNGSVISWDVNFMDENGAVKEIDVAITDMKPGMIPFEKKIEIINRSDVEAAIDYEVKSVKFLGNTLYEGETTENIINSLENDYPFVLSLSPENAQIGIDVGTNFNITLNWTYEENKYYKLNSLYTYDNGVYYYTLTDGIYEIDDTVTEENFQQKLATGLYLEKDDADSFFGFACGNYEKSTNLPCLEMQLELKVSQVN